MPEALEPPRLTPAERKILAALRDAGAGRELYGLQLLHACDGALTRASLYTALDRIEAKGLVTSRREIVAASDVVPIEHRLPRRMFKITGLGQAALVAHEASAAAFVNALANPLNA